MNAEKTLTIPCPHCKKMTTMDKSNLFRPFCSERCKLIDLGDWASENFRIPSEENPPPTTEDQD